MKKIYLLPLLLALFACSNEDTMVQKVDLGQDSPNDQEISSSSETAIESSSSREASTIESSSDALPESSSKEPESSSEAPESSAAEAPESSSSERVVINFDSLPSFVDARDSQAYKYITIGEQVWMAEN